MKTTFQKITLTLRRHYAVRGQPGTLSIHAVSLLRPEQLKENVKALDNLNFTAEELEIIDRHVTDGELNLWQASSDK
jgi:hypothetical protein